MSKHPNWLKVRRGHANEFVERTRSRADASHPHGAADGLCRWLSLTSSTTEMLSRGKSLRVFHIAPLWERTFLRSLPNEERLRTTTSHGTTPSCPPGYTSFASVVAHITPLSRMWWRPQSAGAEPSSAIEYCQSDYSNLYFCIKGPNAGILCAISIFSHFTLT